MQCDYIVFTGTPKGMSTGFFGGSGAGVPPARFMELRKSNIFQKEIS
jgi:hypothetical protein